MDITNTRFGDIQVDPQDVLVFRRGLIGFESCRHWILLADASNDAVAWLQCVTKPEIALPVVSPRRFVPGYRLEVSAEQLDLVRSGGQDEVFVLAIVGREKDRWTVNLKAPLVINLATRLGGQVVAQDDQPLQLELPGGSPILRKTA